ncbi:penicillin amidase [Friedmanniella luteola]|uniref:Penicillin amidase n=1 Tax=Friedmanniella luteola TaxID=546871 RepID=A0A1H1MNI8_9ACTN|nr:penicillin acylase family protein [Friedmanniella luteola]SDR88182.1 penicillin amidase [Friedmanniella luteola]
MRRLPRWLLFPAIVVVLALVVLPFLAVSLVRESTPTTEGRLTLPGLGAPVEVLRDASGVPHVYADNPEDLFEAQGFVAAQDRFFEMDFRRHLAAGRLAELFGESQVSTDAYVRTLGWRRVAEQELRLLSSSTRRYLDAYAAGVNGYLRERSPAELSLEYRLLGVQGLRGAPEAWTAADSLAWLKVMAWQLGSNQDDEASRGLLSATLGPGRVAELYPQHPLEGYDPILDRGDVRGRAFDPDAALVSGRPAPAGLSRAQLQAAQPALAGAAAVDRLLPAVLGTADGAGGIGSNSFVVAGSRTASGKALLSNDPHLATSIPSTFAQVGLHCRTVSKACPFDVSGFSLAAVPGVVIGHNSAVAWGMTTSYADVQDLYLEQVQGDTVRRGPVYEPLEQRTEEIRVRGEDQPRALRIRSSRHGPLLSDVSAALQRVGAQRGESGGSGYAVSVAWVGSTPGRTMDALLGLNRAQDFRQFRAALALLSAPSQNFVYADTAGNIGYQLPGDLPVRGRGDGRTPSPGWDERYDWTGRIPFAQLPYTYNPPSGYLVAANQQVIGRQYPYPVGSGYSYGWRSQEIRDRLADAPPLTLDAAEQIFYDETVRPAAALVPALLKVRVADPWVAEGQRTLVGWDYSASADSAPAAFYNVVVHDLLELTFRDELPQDQWPHGGDRWYAVLDRLLADPDNAWWDDVTTPQVERRDDILLAAMTDARSEITSLMSRDPDGWRWGHLHQVRLESLTLGQSGIAPVEALFNRGHYPVGGGPAVVNALGYDDLLGYGVTTAPTMRMLVDLGALDGSRWINQSGVSGHAFAEHYDDQTELWATNQMLPFVSSRPAVEAATADRLELVPGG